ncbi:uncharacterized protein IL334_005126 [Kwoniella shivajii]|uniref:BZIP domain-containing protein n=1 Tax=Kwoniella shivajii TaxID=564305 RepID=A0ABZ1D596_9TREE|nr:hypothetical protein IL334_005126 [Kwoniella shivajii]
MVRGRPVDLQLPPSRSLLTQREYRARKAARIEQLEEENERLRAENEMLVRQLSHFRELNDRGDSTQTLAQRTWALAMRRDLEQAMTRLDQIWGVTPGETSFAPSSHIILPSLVTGASNPPLEPQVPPDLLIDEQRLSPPPVRMNSLDHNHLTRHVNTVPSVTRLEPIILNDMHEPHDIVYQSDIRSTSSQTTDKRLCPKDNDLAEMTCQQRSSSMSITMPAETKVVGLDESQCCYGFVDCDPE